MKQSMHDRPAIRTATRKHGAAFLILLALGGCSVFQRERPPPPPPPPPPKPVLEAPLATHLFTFQPGVTAVLGELQVTHARHEDTLADIARRFDVGYDELHRANPGVDPWLPGEGTTIVLPTLFVLPDGPREGILINVAAMRLFYFPKAAKDAPAHRRHLPDRHRQDRLGHADWIDQGGVEARGPGVDTARVGAQGARGRTTIRCPLACRPGPDNPLGAYAMNLGWPSYLIHGTNKPPGVGMRASHGCIRLYPEDIESLFGEVAVGTKVTVVNQPLLVASQGDSLYVQSFPVPVEGEDDSKLPAPVAYDAKVAARLQRPAAEHGLSVDTGRWPSRP